MLKSLKVSPDSCDTVRADNAATGKTFGGYGMFWTSDDIAKMAKLLNNDAGKIADPQVLSVSALDASMQREAMDRG